MTYLLSETAIRETIAAIRDIDERADSRDWRWADMPTVRKLAVCATLYQHLSDAEACDIINDAAITRGREILCEEISLQARAAIVLGEWFEQVIEPRINRRIAA